MKIGSHIVCVKPFGDYVVYLAQMFGIPVPKVNEEYIVADMKRCSCGTHDNLELNDREGWWDATHFRELEPPLDLENLLHECEPEQIYAWVR